MLKKCIFCNTLNQDNAEYCINCGKKLFNPYKSPKVLKEGINTQKKAKFKIKPLNNLDAINKNYDFNETVEINRNNKNSEFNDDVNFNQTQNQNQYKNDSFSQTNNRNMPVFIRYFLIDLVIFAIIKFFTSIIIGNMRRISVSLVNFLNNSIDLLFIFSITIIFIYAIFNLKK